MSGNIEDINALSDDAIVARFGFVFEHSPWVVESVVARRPFADVEAMHGALMAVVAEAGPDRQLALLRSHPKLADKAAFVAGLTQESSAEQASAGLDRLTEGEYARFHELNAAYEARFGFPFIIAARLAGGKAGILSAMETRLGKDREGEFTTALLEVGKIVRLRLEDAISPPLNGGGGGPRSGGGGSGLDHHSARVRHDLETLNIGRFDEAPADGIYDVIIVGGGQSGLGSAFGLLRERVTNILVIDENPAGSEGPWETYARMLTLRTPKHLTAIDYGIPSLTFRAFWEAQHGSKGWADLDKIPRGDWMAYLRWYRDVLSLPVQNDTRLNLVEPEDGVYRLETSRGDVMARKVILATGIQGGGEWHIPPFIRDALPPHLYAHTSQPIDLDRLRGKRIAILGGGASAFDNAHHALMAGVAQASVFVRRPSLPAVNPIRHMEATNMIARYGALSDADKYAVMAAFFARNQPPTNDTFARASALPGFSLHLGAPWQAVEPLGEGVAITTPKGRFETDFLIVSTGLITDPALRPELRLVEAGIQRWGDVYAAPPEIRNGLIDNHPYLTPGFAFTGRDAVASAQLQGLYAFNYSALISCGLSASALSGLKYALPRLTAGVADDLYRDQSTARLAAYHAYDDVEFTGLAS